MELNKIFNIFMINIFKISINMKLKIEISLDCNIFCTIANRLKLQDELRDINRFHTPAEYKLIDIYRGWLYFE